MPTRTTAPSRSAPSSSVSSGWNSTRGRWPPRRPFDRSPIVVAAIRPRLAENGRVLVESYRVLAQAIREERTITPAAEWLVDNFAVVDEQLREIRDDLPADYYRELPKLAGGPLDGYPRVLGVAWAYIAHTDSRFDPESLRRMVRAYQEVEPLTIGELWAVAITLRILLVENLRRLAERIVRTRADRQAADELADRLLGVAVEGARPAPRQPWMSCRAPSCRPPVVCSSSSDCGIRIRRRLRRCAGWRSSWQAQGTTAEELVQVQHQRMATMNVTVRNVVTSMRLISWFDWAEFVESVSLVDDVLREGSGFAAMDVRDAESVPHRRGGAGRAGPAGRRSTLPVGRSRWRRARSCRV